VLRLSGAKKASPQSAQSLVEAAWRALNTGHDRRAAEYATQAASAANEVEVLLDLLAMTEEGVKRACQQHFPAQALRWQQVIGLLEQADRGALAGGARK
jgi:hypothetical protein